MISRAYQQGLAVVEFAAIIPIMLLLLLAVGEVARAFHHYTTLHKAAQGGARYAAEHLLNGLQMPELSDDLESRVKNLVVNGKTSATDNTAPLLPDLSTDNVTVTTLESGFSEPHVLVSVVWNYKPIAGMIPLLDDDSVLHTGFDMHSDIVMRAL